ncbi:MAG: hypothetical protein R3A44_34995 [Caldilineaceae bacterium]
MRSAWLWFSIAVILISAGIAILGSLMAELAGLSDITQLRVAIAFALLTALILIGALADYTVRVQFVPKSDTKRQTTRPLEINLSRLISYPLQWITSVFMRRPRRYSHQRDDADGLHQESQEPEGNPPAAIASQDQSRGVPAKGHVGKASPNAEPAVSIPQTQQTTVGDAWDRAYLEIENDPAIRALKARLEYVPYDAESCWDLAKRYVELKAYHQAIDRYKTVLNYRPEFHETRIELIECYRKVQRWDEALAEANYLLGIRRLAAETQNLIKEIKFEMENS